MEFDLFQTQAGFGFLYSGAVHAQTASLAGGQSLDVPLDRLALGGLIIVGLLALSWWVSRRARQGSLPGASTGRPTGFFQNLANPPRLAVVERRRIGAQTEICLIVCDDREYTILISAQQTLVLRDQAAATGTRRLTEEVHHDAPP